MKKLGAPSLVGGVRRAEFTAHSKRAATAALRERPKAALLRVNPTPELRSQALAYLEASETTEKMAELRAAVAFHVERHPELAKIPPEELLALKHYTRGGFREMNAHLRGDASGQPGLVALIQCATSALEQLPHFVGNVRRGLRLTEERLARYQPGSLVTEPAFLSTSRSALTPEFELKTLRLFIKSDSAGRDVSMLSNAPEEREVLFLPGTQFKVTKVRQVSGLTYSTAVYLQELPLFP